MDLFTPSFTPSLCPENIQALPCMGVLFLPQSDAPALPFDLGGQSCGHARFFWIPPRCHPAFLSLQLHGRLERWPTFSDYIFDNISEVWDMQRRSVDMRAGCSVDRNLLICLAVSWIRALACMLCSRGAA